MVLLTSKHSDHELEKMATHVLYEVDMFRSCFARWRSLDAKDSDWNPVLESSLLHFRVLREFFLSRVRTHNDDVLASDYMNCPIWSPTEAKIFAETKDEIDKRLAHLTTRRLQPRIIWKRGEMEVAMEDLVSKFKAGLCDKASVWFAKLQINRPRVELFQDESCSTASVIKYNN